MTTSGEVSKAARRLHMHAETFGIELDAKEDILTEQGLNIAFGKLKRIRRGGLFVVQPPCKRWLCFVSRTLSERTFDDNVSAGSAMRGAGNAMDVETRMANRTAIPVASLIWSALEHDTLRRLHNTLELTQCMPPNMHYNNNCVPMFLQHHGVCSFGASS